MKETGLDIFRQFAKGSSVEDRSSKTKAVIYTRVSSKGQLDNASLEVQMELCEGCAARKNLTVVEYFGGTHESAKTDDRKEFQRMLNYVKRNKEIGYIVVYNFKRFSRTGVSKISLDLEERGVHVISATQEIDPNTGTGIFQKHLYLELAKLDNEDRRRASIDGMRKKLRNGNITGSIPFGYTNLNPGKKRNPELVINEQGKLLVKAFELKAKYDLSHQEITDRLKKYGWKKGRKRLSEYFRNPVYCGLIVSSIIPGEVIQGNHPPLVSKETFLKVNNVLNKKDYGKKHKKDDENLPLKQFVYSHTCGTAYTGYLVRKKNLYYYKNNRIGSKENRSAKMMHALFVELLQSYQLRDKKWREPMKEMLTQVMVQLHEESLNALLILEKKASEIESKLETLERRFVFGEIERELYLKYKRELDKELIGIQEEISESAFNLSNLETAVDNAVNYALNLPKIWTSGDLAEKRRVQKMVFPEGIRYNHEKHQYRTAGLSSLFAGISMIQGDTNGYEKRTSSKNWNLSGFVAATGIEPVSKV